MLWGAIPVVNFQGSMRKLFLPFLALTLIFLTVQCCQAQKLKPIFIAKPQVIEKDICIYGGISAGVIAGYSSHKLGKSAIIIEPGRHLGGMTASGLGSTDIGNKYAITGLSKDFYRRMGTRYNNFEQWNLEPFAAESLFIDYTKRAKVPVQLGYRLFKVVKQGNKIVEVVFENSQKPDRTTDITVRAKVFMDCSYEGDLMAAAKVSYTVGREANDEFNETLNGVQLQHLHQFPDGVDPYIEKGNPASGLLWGISPYTVAPNGMGDRKVQAYNFRLCLTDKPENRIPFSQPENYDPKKYALLARLIEVKKSNSLGDLMIINRMPNGKTDCNHKGGFSLDHIGANWDYPEANYEDRLKIWKDHENYIKGFLWFLANDESVPERIRQQTNEFGWPKDEFKDNGGFPWQLYVREARRMRSDYVMSQANCQQKEIVSDGIGLAAYTMDSHNCQRVVKNGMVKNEGNVEVGFPRPYPISYRSIVPKQAECGNLFVPVCLSATHIAYGSIRMEPVFMVLAQSAAIAASMAIDAKTDVQKVSVQAIQKKLADDPLLDKSTPEVLVDDANEELLEFSEQGWSQKDDINSKYGPTYLMADTSTKSVKWVKFKPQVKKAGNYRVLVFGNGDYKKRWDRFLAPNIKCEIKHSQGVQSFILQPSEYMNEWKELGTFYFKPEDYAYVRLSNLGSSQGWFAADAVLLVPVTNTAFRNQLPATEKPKSRK